MQPVPMAHVDGRPPVPIVGLSSEAADYLTPGEPDHQAEAAALAEFVTMLCATLDTIETNPDLSAWIATATEGWTVSHARQALLFAGLLCQASEVTPDMVAELGRTMLAH